MLTVGAAIRAKAGRRSRFAGRRVSLGPITALNCQRMGFRSANEVSLGERKAHPEIRAGLKCRKPSQAKNMARAANSRVHRPRADGTRPGAERLDAEQRREPAEEDHPHRRHRNHQIRKHCIVLRATNHDASLHAGATPEYSTCHRRAQPQPDRQSLRAAERNTCAIDRTWRLRTT